MKIFIKNEYVDLEKFSHFYWKDGQMILAAPFSSNSLVTFSHNHIRMTKEEYNELILFISRHYEIPMKFCG